MIGVDYELFWTLNPKSLSAFIKAFSLKQKYDDAMAWQAGMYIKLAIASSLGKDNKYPKKPFLENESEQKPMSQEEIKRRFMIHAQLINSKFRKED